MQHIIILWMPSTYKELMTSRVSFAWIQCCLLQLLYSLIFTICISETNDFNDISWYFQNNFPTLFLPIARQIVPVGTYPQNCSLVPRWINFYLSVLNSVCCMPTKSRWVKSLNILCLLLLSLLLPVSWVSLKMCFPISHYTDQISSIRVHISFCWELLYTTQNISCKPVTATQKYCYCTKMWQFVILTRVRNIDLILYCDITGDRSCQVTCRSVITDVKLISILPLYGDKANLLHLNLEHIKWWNLIWLTDLQVVTQLFLTCRKVSLWKPVYTYEIKGHAH